MAFSSVQPFIQSGSSGRKRLDDEFFHGTFRYSEPLGDLRMAETVELMHEKNLPLPGRKICNDVFENGDALAEIGRLLRRGICAK